VTDALAGSLLSLPLQPEVASGHEARVAAAIREGLRCAA